MHFHACISAILFCLLILKLQTCVGLYNFFSKEELQYLVAYFPSTLEENRKNNHYKYSLRILC